jgi:aspartate/methionine/tyrosine aminotransferase
MACATCTMLLQNVYNQELLLACIGWAMPAPTDHGWPLRQHASPCTALQILALMALRAKDHIIARNLATIRTNLGLARQLVADMPHLLEWREPKAGSVAFPRIKACADVEAFCESLVAEAGILLLPATVYDDPGAVAKGHFRLGLGRADFAEKLQLLRKHLEGEFGQGGNSAAVQC